MIKNIIAWDLGATKCTAGLMTADAQSNFVCKKTYTIKLKDAASLSDLVNQFNVALDYDLAAADAICIGAAGHFDGRTIQHENPYPFSMTIADIAEQQNWPAYAVIHDYASIVCSTFTAHIEDDKNVRRLNDCKLNPHGRRVAFGVGTGLGLKDGIKLPDGDFWLGHNEMGHIGITMPPLADMPDRVRHQAFINFLQREFPGQPATFEKILSGYGIVRLHQFLYPEVKNISPEEAGDSIQNGKSPELLDLFAWYLGLFVGTVQLSFMPSGGIFMTGGVTLNHLNVFDEASFNRGIHATPAYLTQRKEYPLMVLRNAENALYGCGYYALKRLF